MSLFEHSVRPHGRNLSAAPRVAVFGLCALFGLAATRPAQAQDALEPNGTLATASGLGSDPFVSLDNLTIFPAADLDFFRYTAPFSGMLAVDVLFTNASGNINIALLDGDGDTIATSAGAVDNEHIVSPVVGGQTYFVFVSAVGAATNTYDLAIQCTPAPVPAMPDLSSDDDSGPSNQDNVTFRTAQVNFFVDVDLDPFFQKGIAILTPAQANAGNTPGVAVRAFVTQESTGSTATVYASRIMASTRTFEFSTDFDPTDGETFFVEATVQVFDAADPTPASDHGEFSAPLIVTSDNTAPVAPSGLLLAGGLDTGSLNNDHVTSVSQPTIVGIAEPRTRATVFANGLGVGQGVVGDDATDGVFGNNRGVWVVTSGQLADGIRSITTNVDDAAGNISPQGVPLTIEVDTTPPNTPFLDLVASDDSGISNEDSITHVSTPHATAFINDPAPPGGHLLADNVKFRIYDRTGASPETLIVDSNVLGANGAFPIQLFGDGVSTPLAEGLHNLKLVAEDRAGNLSHPFLLDVLIDTVPPAAPTISLLAASDAPPAGDGLTEVSAPGFAGTGEADTTACLFVDGTLIGKSPVKSDGHWAIASPHLADGDHVFTARLEDAAGNLSPISGPVNLTIDSNQPIEFSGTAIGPVFCGSTMATMLPMTVVGLIGVRGYLRRRRVPGA